MEHHGEALRKTLRDEEKFADIQTSFMASEYLSPKELAALEFSKRLTLEPQSVSKEDYEKLAAADFSDEEVLHVTEVTAYFNFVNRMASGLGVELES